MKRLVFVLPFSFLLPATAAPIPVTGSMQYTENFNALSNTPNNNLSATNWSDSVTIPGWYFYRAGNGTAAGSTKGFAGANFPYRVTDGGLQSGQTGTLINTGWFYSMGNSGEADRALGVVPISAQGELSYLAVFQNTGAVPVRLSQIAYNAEIWRTNQSSGVVETIMLWWRKAPTEAELLNMVTGAVVPADWPADVATSPNAHYVTGWNHLATADYTYTSAAANTQTYESHPVSAAPGSEIEILPNEFLAVRWGNFNDRDADALMGIDDLDLTFTALDNAVSGAVSNIVRSDAGTLRNPGDDTVNFDLTVTGNGAVGPGWKISAPASLTAINGTYGAAVNVTGVPIADFTGASHVLNMTIEDAGNPAINAPVQAVAPWGRITPEPATGFFYDQRTAGAADDQVGFSIKVDGPFTGTLANITVAGSVVDSAPYGLPFALTASAPGTYVTYTFTDNLDPSITATLDVFPPAIIGTNATTLTPVPLLSLPVGQNGAIRWTVNAATGAIVQNASPVQSDQVLLSDLVNLSTAGDVEFTATLTAATGTSSGFEPEDSFALDLIIDGGPPVSVLGTADSDGDGRLTTAAAVELQAAANTTRTFNFAYTVPAAASSVQVRLTGNSNSAAETFTVSALSIAIPQPEITLSAASNIIRNLNGPGTADDTVSFDVTISGANGGSGWTTTGATPSSGLFGAVTLTVPAGGNSVTLRITDDTYPAAFADITVPLPGPYIIGSLDLGAGSTPVFTDAAAPPDAAWVIDASAGTLTMNNGAVAGATDKIVTSEILDLSAVTGPVRFNANLHVNDKTGGFEATDTFLAVLIYDGDTANPVSLVDAYDTDLSGRMNGGELAPVPVPNPSVNDYDYPLAAIIPDSVNTVQLIITGLNNSANETMIVGSIRFGQSAPDADSDGMSDAYEDAHGLDKNSAADRDLDADGDGQSNYLEFVAGTAANDVSSRLHITGSTVNKLTGAASVTWASVSGKRYRFQVSPDLNTPWIGIGPVVTAAGPETTTSAVIPGAPLPDKGFLRIAVVE